MVALPIGNPTVQKIYSRYEKDENPRSYLGMSQMGDPCDRSLWLSFRWAGGKKHFIGRMKRLFETGHREEARMVADLLAIGIRVRHVGADQATLKAIDDHFQGHPDGEAEGFEEAPKAVHVLETKTHNEKSFKDLVSKGVKLSKPAHYAQVQLYMHYTGAMRTFYLAHNKNTDELYQERIAYDEIEALQLIARAERIIRSPSIPPKISEKPDHFQCLFCDHNVFCHHPSGVFSTRSCRTCLSSKPVQAGLFNCDLHNHVNDVPAQKLGCSKHLYLPDLVPGEQVDVDTDARTVTYELKNGLGAWIDGAPNG